jgi:uncharacterized protein (UPF0332 family)
VTAQDALARHRLARAREALAEADLLITENRWNGALNRLYYAAFYDARALLALRRLDSSRHSGVIALFQEHFVKTEAVPAGRHRTIRPRVRGRCESFQPFGPLELKADS